MAIKTPVFSASNLFSCTLYLSEYIYGVLFILHLIYICLGQIWWHIRLNFSLFCLPTNVISDLSNICLLAKYSQMHDFIQCICLSIFLFEEWGMRSSKARVGSWDTVKMRETQNESAFKIRTHSKWERIQNERTYAKWEQPQNGKTLEMTKHRLSKYKTTVKIQETHQ